MNVVVILVRSEGPLNVGSVARLCGNFGVGLRLVDVRADTAGSEAMKMAHPSEDILTAAPRFATLREALHDTELAIATSSKMATALAGPALELQTARHLLPAGLLALVFGNERTGLSLQEAAQCTRVMRLPLAPARDSMNLSHAVASTLTILALAHESAVQTRASVSSRAALQAAWTEALAAAGFYAHTPELAFAPRLLEILDKMDVSDRDVDILRGMFTLFRRQIHGLAVSPDSEPPTS